MDRTRPCKAGDPHDTHGWKATLDGGTRFRVTCPGVPGAVTNQTVAVVAPEPAPAVDYTTQTRAALRDLARARGLTVRGTSTELAARLTAHDHA